MRVADQQRNDALCRDVTPTVERQQRQEGIAEGCQRLECLVGMDLAAIFPQGFIPDIVEAVLDGSMPAAELRHLLGAG